MPPIVAAAAVTGIAGLATTIAGSKINSGAQRRASDVAARGNRDALAQVERQDAEERAYRKEQDERAQANWDAEQAFREREYNESQANKRQMEALYFAENARRNAGRRRLAEIAGVDFTPLPTSPIEGPAPVTMPTGGLERQPPSASTMDRRRTLAQIGAEVDPNAPIRQRIRPTRPLREIGSPRYGMPGRM